LVIVIKLVGSIGTEMYKNISNFSELNILFWKIFGCLLFQFVLLLTKQVIDVFISLGCNMFPC
jgi:hypothetical protein